MTNVAAAGWIQTEAAEIGRKKIFVYRSNGERLRGEGHLAGGPPKKAEGYFIWLADRRKTEGHLAGGPSKKSGVPRPKSVQTQSGRTTRVAYFTVLRSRNYFKEPELK